MTKRTAYLSTLLAGALCLGAAQSRPAAAGEAAKKRALRIAIVDVDKVLKGYKKGNDRYDKIKKELEPFGNAIKQKAKFIREEQRRLAGDPRTDKVAYIKKKHRIEVQLAELERDEKDYIKRRTEKEIEAMIEVWKDVVAAVGKYAKDNGIDLVIKQQVRDDHKPQTKSTFYRNVAARTVLYAAAHLDITEEITKQLNKAYERGVDAAKG